MTIKTLLTSSITAAVLLGAAGVAQAAPNYDEPIYLQNALGGYIGSTGVSTFGLPGFNTWTLSSPDGSSGTVQDGDAVYLSVGGFYYDGFSMGPMPTEWIVELDTSNDAISFHSTVFPDKSLGLLMSLTPTAGANPSANTFLIQPHVAGKIANCTDDMYMGMLSRIATKATNNVTHVLSTLDVEDILDPTGHWDFLEMCLQTPVWDEIVANGKIVVGNSGSYKVRAVTSRYDDQMWIAFAGLPDDDLFDLLNVNEAGFIDWPGTSGADVHAMFYAHWESLEGAITTWLGHSATDDVETVHVGGHSRGGVMSQYFLADVAEQELSHADIYLTLLGSPNGGNAAFIDHWCDLDNLVSARHYVNRVQYTGWDLGRHGVRDDFVLWRKKMFSLYAAYPRGLGRNTTSSIEDMCPALEKQTYLHEDGSYWDDHWQAAQRVHGSSFYLTTLEKVSMIDVGLIETFDAMDL